jgi:hypothetical protein
MAKTKIKPIAVADVRVRERQNVLVLFDPQTQTFVGARQRQPHYSLMYSLGDYDTAYHLSDYKSATETLKVVRGFKQYSLLTEQEAKRIRIRRVRSRTLIIGAVKK